MSLGEIRKSESTLELNSSQSNPKNHSPMLRPKTSEKIDLGSATLLIPANSDIDSAGFKLSNSSNRDKASSLELFDIGITSAGF